MAEFKEGDKVKIAMFNALTFENRRWVDATVTSLMEDFTKHRNDGLEYYAVDIEGIDVDKAVHFFAPSDNMFREGEELPDIDEFIENFKNKLNS